MTGKDRYTGPYRPQTDGKVERFRKTLKEDFIKDALCEDIDDLKNELSGFWSVITNTDLIPLSVISRLLNAQTCNELVDFYSNDGCGSSLCYVIAGEAKTRNPLKINACFQEIPAFAGMTAPLVRGCASRQPRCISNCRSRHCEGESRSNPGCFYVNFLTYRQPALLFPAIFSDRSTEFVRCGSFMGVNSFFEALFFHCNQSRQGLKFGRKW